MDKYNFRFRLEDSLKMDYQRKIDTIYTCKTECDGNCIVTWPEKDNYPGTDISEMIYPKSMVDTAIQNGFWIKIVEVDGKNG